MKNYINDESFKKIKNNLEKELRNIKDSNIKHERVLVAIKDMITCVLGVTKLIDSLNSFLEVKDLFGKVTNLILN
jgi:hypothetical protein